MDLTRCPLWVWGGIWVKELILEVLAATMMPWSVQTKDEGIIQARNLLQFQESISGGR